MKTVNVRQIASVVEDDLLSHLTDEALADYQHALQERSVPDAASRFPGETINKTQVQELLTAVNAEATRRDRAGA